MAKEELSRECDYELEAANQKRFRNLLSCTEGFYVPFVVDNLSSKKVLTTELVPGNYITSFIILSSLLMRRVQSEPKLYQCSSMVETLRSKRAICAVAL